MMPPARGLTRNSPISHADHFACSSREPVFGLILSAVDEGIDSLLSCFHARPLVYPRDVRGSFPRSQHALHFTRAPSLVTDDIRPGTNMRWGTTPSPSWYSRTR